MTGRPQQLRRVFFAALILFVSAMLAMTAYTLWRLHGESISNGLELSASHARSAEDFLTQNLHVTELVAASAGLAGNGEQDLRHIERSFVTTLQHAPFLRSLSLLDTHGRIVASSNPANIGVRVSTESYQPQAPGSLAVLRIGQPWVGRDFADGHPSSAQVPVAANEMYFVPLMRTLGEAQRNMTLLVALNPDYFINHMSEMTEAREGFVEVLRYDGTLLIDTGTDGQVGAQHGDLVQQLRLTEVEAGQFEQNVGQPQRELTAYRVSRLYPLVVIAHLHREHALASWQVAVKTLLGVVIPALLLICFLAVAFYRRQLQLAVQRAEADRQQRITAIVFEASAEAIIITDLHGNIVSVNPAFVHITGYSAQEVVGRNPRLLGSGQQDKDFYKKLWDTLLHVGVWQGEIINRRKDGSLYDARVSIVVSRDSAGQVQHFIGDLTDVTAQKQAQARHDEVQGRLRKIASRVPGVLFEFRLRPNGSACFPYCSDAIRALYGNRIAPEDIREDGAAVFALIHPDDLVGMLTSIQQSAQDLTPWLHEYRVRFEDGSVRWFLGSSQPEREADGSVLWHGFISDVTERKKSDAQRLESESRLRALIDALPDLVWLKDVDGIYRACNTRFEKFFGASEKDIVGKTDYDFLDAALADSFRMNDQAAMDKGRLHLNEEWISFADDGHRELQEISKIPMFDLEGCLVGVLGIGHDITTKKQGEEKLQLAASVFAHSREGIMITAADGTIVDVNDAFSGITGYCRAEVLGRNPRILSSGRQGKEFYAEMWRSLIEKGHCYGEVWNRRKSGEVYAAMQTISAVCDTQGQTQHYVSLFSDITALKEHQLQLEHIAHFDALTSLPNRVLLADRMRQGISQVQRRGQLLAVAFLDLDGFKAINDNHGHEAGDQLLIAVSTRMKQALREGDTLARIGGDEFVAVLLDLPSVDACAPMLTRLLAAAAQPVQFGEASLQVSASLGVTFFPQAEEVDADLMLRQADQAMYQAKLAGKNRYHVFDAEQDRSMRGHHESVERIRLALAEGEFVLYYQPKVNMRTGQVIGAEALIRWQHPQRGLLAPTVFLPIIEDHPLAVNIGEWVIDTALSQIERWQAQGLSLPVSVNVGARQLQQVSFVVRLREILAQHPAFKPGQLTLEVLETSALEDMVSVSQVIDACRAMGVMFALDDFGTGYSSLTYLKRLQVKQLKIDQSFVRDMLDDPDDLAILDGVIGLASAFRREVIAEGVETVAHGTLLLQLGCELAQGYGIARPMPAHQLPGWAAAWRPEAGWIDLPPIHREDLPLLFAMVEHRAWVLAVEAFLKGEREAPPPQAIQQCRLSSWLDTEGVARYGTQAAFQAIGPLHIQVHALVNALCAFHLPGQHPQALAQLDELHTLRDALLAALQTLVQRAR